MADRYTASIPVGLVAVDFGPGGGSVQTDDGVTIVSSNGRGVVFCKGASLLPGDAWIVDNCSEIHVVPLESPGPRAPLENAGGSQWSFAVLGLVCATVSIGAAIFVVS